MTVSFDKILFFDIETAPQIGALSGMSEEMQHLWEEKIEKLSVSNPQKYCYNSIEESWSQAAIYAEFGRIVCISVGFVYSAKDGEWHLKTKSFCGENETQILIDFFALSIFP